MWRSIDTAPKEKDVQILVCSPCGDGWYYEVVEWWDDMNQWYNGDVFQSTSAFTHWKSLEPPDAPTLT